MIGPCRFSEPVLPTMIKTSIMIEQMVGRASVILVSFQLDHFFPAVIASNSDGSASLISICLMKNEELSI